MAKTLHPMWPPANVEAVCRVLASTDRPGLSGSEISKLLAMRGVADVNPTANKRDRLWAALMTKQQANQASNCIIRFINDAMAPGRFVHDSARFAALKDALNEPLALMALRVNDQGEVARATGASTLDEVAKLAGRLRTELNRRGIHPEIVKYCEEEILRKSLFHAVFEATKGVAERLRQMSKSNLDGSKLVDFCFSTKNPPPVVRINNFITETEISEHTGFANLLRGVFGTFRNPPAHTPRAAAGWTISEPDALDLFAMLSFMHRRLDGATV
ncbi:TIGR02391 family protein [Streptomyces sp. AM 4-1-1]|uniref:TIGR02391 family protein n=1 Tax=Streptomyces sp. AM 4-1-1 TaxID=3028710 RepID=UPI0023B9AAAD|nr:TIGR02391 family protein [Streptomyces sp. AM 4-1-1]WEH37204.1 TIGR02391 family protein [Streptomyces sp. AM 4-1-1]